MNSSPSIIGFKTIFRSKIIYGLALILIDFPAHSAVGNGAQLEHVRLQLKWLHQFQFAGYYAAIEQGYYEGVGLQVELFENAPGINVVDQVVSGCMDYGIGDSPHPRSLCQRTTYQSRCSDLPT